MINGRTLQLLQYRHLVPAPVDRTSGSTWLYKHRWIACKENEPDTLMTHVATFSCEVIRVSLPRKLDGNQACGYVLCPGCPLLLISLCLYIFYFSILHPHKFGTSPLMLLVGNFTIQNEAFSPPPPKYQHARV